MLSKAKIKYFSSFHTKKQRLEENAFIVEGAKLVSELLQSDYVIISIVATPEWFAAHQINIDCECIEASLQEIAKISALSNPQEVWALVSSKTCQISSESIGNQFVLALDGIQDPGNLGTIIRLAEWFGISQIVCSIDTVEMYNPKVVQATMGAVFRVKVSYVDLPQFLRSCNQVTIFAADLEGENIYTSTLPQYGIVIMGNEGKGISSEVESCITRKLHIPSFNVTDKNSESLNVAIATAVICSEFKRRTY